MIVDWLIRGGSVVDGTGAPAYIADVAFRDGRLCAIGVDLECQAASTIDARGLTVAPGFIDSHTHDDTAVCSLDAIRPKLLQGVTSVIAGNCGIGAAPLTRPNPPPPLDLLDKRWFRFARYADFLAEVERVGPHLNVAYLVGHTALRAQVMPVLDRKASAGEAAQMSELLAEALQAGAIGASIGTYYPPAKAADADEIVAVCSPLDAKRHRLTVHLRDEGDAIMDALKEADEIAHRLNVPLVISHHKLFGVKNHGRSRETLKFIEEIAQTRSVCMDCYPYEASSTMLIPSLADQATKVLVAWSDPCPEFAGVDLDEVAIQLGCNRADAAQRLAPGGATYFSMDLADVKAILSHPLTIVASDGLPHDRNPHPRLWGTFPRAIGRLAREGWFPLEEAIRKITSFPAERFGLRERGQLKVGYHADIVVLAAETVIDTADYAHPRSPPRDIRHVFLNGQLKVDCGRIDAMPGGTVLKGW